MTNKLFGILETVFRKVNFKLQFDLSGMCDFPLGQKRANRRQRNTGPP